MYKYQYLVDLKLIPSAHKPSPTSNKGIYLPPDGGCMDQA